LVWRSERSVLDLLGPVQLGDSPAFAIAGRDYLRAANLLGTETDLDEKRAGIRAAESNLRKLVDVSVTRHAVDDVSLSIRASFDPLQQVVVEGLQVAGQASLLIGSKSDAVIVDAVPTQVDEEPVVSVPGPAVTRQLSAPVSSNRLITVLRGHEFVSKFGDDQTLGRRVVAEPSSDTRTTVTIRKNQQDLSALFLVDGSSSMRDSDKGKSRIARTKKAISTALGQMSETEGVRCGVSFYGHRVGYDVKDVSQQIRVHPAYLGHIPDGLIPENDVETVLPLGRFQPFEAASVRHELAKLTGWGQSPHYRALLSAVGAFASEREEGNRVIVWFTDGDDLAEGNDGGRRLESISWFEVVDSVRKSGISVHIVSPGSSHAADRNLLREIENASNGSFRRSDRVASLLPEILARLKTHSFAVRGQKSPQMPQLSSPQGTTTKEVASMSPGSKPDAELIDTQAINHMVSIEEADQYQSLKVSVGEVWEQIPIVGGENIELSLSPNRTEFIVPTYRRRFARELQLLGANGLPVAVSAYLHRPDRSGSHVAFEVSFQQDENRYVPRPKTCWIEIKPLGRKEYSPFVFYDASFVVGAPVPVLQCRTPDWPMDADQAAVRIWYSPQGVSHNSQVIACDILIGDDTRMKNEKGVMLRASQPIHSSKDELVLELTEQHDADSGSFERLMVEFVGMPRPHRIVHRYDSDRRVVNHQFLFRGGESDSITAGKIRVTNRRAIEPSSWRSGDPLQLTIDVPNGADVIIAR
ncbi:VWA domain-containing protein, partial [Planctomycetota bacterium]